MSQPRELSLEQEFDVRSFETQVQRMSREQAQEFLVKLYEQMMLRENMYKEFIKHEWGLDKDPFSDS
ncbi:MAG: NblA-related protein [Cyanobacteria bacterium QH_8_48_120]|nr:MAG: NblA-related protein [Cyanobacteria bacterium QH_1_48_107]PSO56227.1 MAG: NblA-related protein [Cyanobacteria bacterium QH_10_48_56]PSO61299.1 MAG: NblA-related protein [Cyanobacteria bacterium QH_2_48_84]PSO61350.1 MAG: NblA-related protein [Cyanobacteria bacterium QH_7_48_89]PSO64213.1 MAG: NblA-related protein [Cyanobacteria bacterium QH_6_48_35]PSO69567.1 MAG: NblA-related protein [Cyanobacteria bacterium QS_1_48_34]PSO70829.1 MAG: NblA-related protein [Cyanobacteria bacterium QH_